MIPCYNEEENIVPMSEEIVSLFKGELCQYDYELLFIDNDSSDDTRLLLRIRKIKCLEKNVWTI